MGKSQSKISKEDMDFLQQKSTSSLWIAAFMFSDDSIGDVTTSVTVLSVSSLSSFFFFLLSSDFWIDRTLACAAFFLWARTRKLKFKD